MQLSTETFGNVLVIHTPDEVTEASTGPLTKIVSNHLQQGRSEFVLQMDRSEIYDSAGLMSLLELQKLARDSGGAMKVSGLVHPGRKIFEMTRLDQRFDLYDTVLEAVSSFR